MFNQRQMKQAMKRMGIKSEEIDAEEVVIKCREKNIVIKEPSVSKIKMGAQETFQVIGNPTEVLREKFSQEDVELVMDQTGCDMEEARKALDETEDIARAIMYIKENS